MKPPHLHPLGDFKPADQWQTHVNAIFYGTKGPAIHAHFQTYASRDYRLAHALAKEFFQQITSNPKAAPDVLHIQEWGVGNGNLAARFLDHLKNIDSENRVYPRVRYLLCDYSEEILNGVRANPALQEHAGHFDTQLVNAERLAGFTPQSVMKIISNEIWDDLATRVLLASQGNLFEEYLQPFLPEVIADRPFEQFLEEFNEKNLAALITVPDFLDKIVWERNYQRVDLGDWPFSDIIGNHMKRVSEDTPIPINTGAFNTIRQAKDLLVPGSQGYTGFDYGMLSMDHVNWEGRPYFKIYGGQYTSMVNFPLMAEVGRAVGFDSVQSEPQHDYVGRHLNDKVISLVELVHGHREAPRMEPWHMDLLMLKTLNVLNTTYHNPYPHKMDYPVLPGTPKKYRKLIAQEAKNLSVTGVPDTVAYVTEGEVFAVAVPLKKLGYREKDLHKAFNPSDQPITFGHMRFQPS